MCQIRFFLNLLYACFLCIFAHAASVPDEEFTICRWNMDTTMGIEEGRIKSIVTYFKCTESRPEYGATAQKGNLVKVHYTSWLQKADGSKGMQFDSSIKRGQPFSFPLGAGVVTKGWDKGIRGMRIGEKRILIIPARLGYGVRGAGTIIPPKATLICEIKLLEVGE